MNSRICLQTATSADHSAINISNQALSPGQLVVWLMLVLFSGQLFAEHSRVFGDYKVYYSILDSQELPASYSQKHQFNNKPGVGLVKIYVEPASSGQKSLQPPVVTGKINNMENRQTLNFFKVADRGKTYYFAEFNYKNDDICLVEIDLQTDPQKAPYRLKFSRSLKGTR